MGSERRALTVALLVALTACSSPPEAPPGELPECTSLFGEPLFSPPVDPERAADLQKGLDESLARLEASPTDPEALIDYGRRLSSVNRFADAVEVFSLGLQRWPDDVRLLRFRGHRYITLRKFDLAIADLERAAQLMEGQPDEVEPTVPPNAAGLDLDTLHENVWYHLALAHYLRGEFETALDLWGKCSEIAPNDDGRAMCAYWMASAALRAAAAAREADDRPRAAELRHRAAAALKDISYTMSVQEYVAYWNLALVFKGAADAAEVLRAARNSGPHSVDFATVAYGIANWHLCRGETVRARALLENVCRGASWQAFGHIAAEAELARLDAR